MSFLLLFPLIILLLTLSVFQLSSRERIAFTCFCISITIASTMLSLIEFEQIISMCVVAMIFLLLYLIYCSIYDLDVPLGLIYYNYRDITISISKCVLLLFYYSTALGLSGMFPRLVSLSLILLMYHLFISGVLWLLSLRALTLNVHFFIFGNVILVCIWLLGVTTLLPILHQLCYDHALDNRLFNGTNHYGVNPMMHFNREFGVESLDLPPVVVQAELPTPQPQSGEVPLLGRLKKAVKLPTFFNSFVVDALGLNINNDVTELFDNELASSYLTFCNQHENVISKVENMLIAISQIAIARNRKAQSLAIVGFIKMMNPNRSISLSVISACSNYWDVLHKDVEPQSAEFFIESAHNLLKDWDAAKSTPAFVRLQRFWMFAFTAGMFQSIGITPATMGYSKFEQKILQKDYPSLSCSMAECMVKTSVYILRTGLQVFKYGDYSGLIHSDHEYVKLYESYCWLRARRDLFNASSTSDFTEVEYRDKLRDTLEKYTAVTKYMINLKAPEKKIMIQHHNDLEKISLEINSQSAALSDRPMPFSILLHSPPGRGKSRFTEIVYQYFGKVIKEPTGSRFRFVRNAAAKFWDGFRTEQWCVIVDDIAFMNPNKASQGDPTATEFLQIINTVPYVPDQADLKDKGRIPLRAKLVIGTTNTRHMHAKSYYSAPAAVHRRFPFIVEISVKKKYATKDGQLDVAKVDKGAVPNCWRIIVSEVKLTDGGKNTEDKVKLDTTEISKFLLWYREAILSHEKKKKEVAATQSFVEKQELCDKCNLFSSQCVCEVEAQSSFKSFFFKEPTRKEKFVYWLASHYHNARINVLIFIYESSFVQRYLHRVFYSKLVNPIMSIRPALVYSNMGKRVKRLVSPPRSLVLICMGLAIAATILRLASPSPQGGMQSVPEPLGEEHQNIWHQSEIPVEQYDTSDKAKCTTMEHFRMRLERNMIYAMNITGTDTGKPCRMINIGRTNWLVPSHCVPELDTFEMRTVGARTGTNSGRVDITVSQIQVTRLPERDLALISIPQLGNYRSLRDHLPSEQFDFVGSGLHISRAPDGRVIEHSAKIRGKTLTSISKIGKLDVRPYTMNVTTSIGTCGVPLVASTPGGPMLLGIHSAGHPSDVEYKSSSNVNCYATNVTLDMVKKLESMQVIPQTSEQNIVDPSIPSVKVSVGILHPKAAIHWIGDCLVRSYGSLSTGRARPKSRVRPSLFSSFLTDRGWFTSFGAPIMRSWKPWNIALSDLGNPVTKMDMGIMHQAYEGFKNDILKDLPPSELKLLHPLTDSVTINGAPSVAFIDGVKRNTSAGFPWKKSKRFVSHSVPSPPGLDHIDYDKEVWEKIDLFRSTYLSGKRCGVIFNAHLKDEAVSAKKRLSGKTRVFTGAPLPYTHLMRQYFLSSVRVIQRNRFIFESMVGVVAQSPEWKQVHDYVTVFGNDRIVAGDYKAFDKRMPGFVIMYAFRIIMDLCEKSGNYDEEDMMVMRGLATDTAFPMVDFNGDLLEFIGSNPSGHPLTVIINSLVNSLYIRYCYIKLHPECRVDDFRQNVALATYGDDNIMGSRLDWFSHTAIAEVLADVEITYTMADKEAKSVPFISIDNSSFLKRTWRYAGGVYFCPLERDSLVKMMMLTIPSKMVSSDVQHAALLDTYLRESFHHGLTEFTIARTLVEEILETYQLDFCYPGGSPPTYQKLLLDFEDAGRKIKPLYPSSLSIFMIDTPLA